MEKIKSLFIKIGLLLFPLVAGLVAVELILTYNITYDSNLKIYEKQIQRAGELCVQYCEAYNLLDDDIESKGVGEMFNNVCKTFDITYSFAVDPDLESKNETYLIIGFGENASMEAVESRYRGVVVEGSLNDSEIQAYNGETGGVILHEINRFDDSLVCYMPCTRYFDFSKADFVYYDHPLIIGTEISLTEVNAGFQSRFIGVAVIAGSAILVMLAIFVIILYFWITRPIRRISDRMSSFVTDRKEGIQKLPVKGSDELAQMAASFNTMTEEIDRYINDIDALTKEKHTQETELDIARRIQMGLLQPEYTEYNTGKVNAYMLPAKDVGGDLYDYRILDDGRVFVAIADVSGKGISAALFMSRAITLLHMYSCAGFNPAEILEKYNHTLALNNPSGLFITTFVAFYDPVTGKLTYSNAGHNFPYILSESLIPLCGAHGVAAGLFDGETYENAEITLEKGDVLFLYTDGVNEAKNAEGEFYSTERLEEKLRLCIETSSSDVLKDILCDLDVFTRGAQQNDDITMLTFYADNNPSEITLHLTSELQQFTKVKEAIFSLPVSDDMKKTLHLAAEEIFVNICSYAYDVPGEVELRITADRGVGMTFSDSGKPFDPTGDVVEIEEYDHENAIGGLGRFLAFSVADEYRYEYLDGKNVLYLYFNEVKENDDNQKA